MLWAAFAGIFLIVLIAILWPLRIKSQTTLSRQSFDLAVYKDQLREIERDLDNGVIGAGEAEAAKLEVSRKILRLNEAESGQETASPDASGSGIKSFVALAISVFLAGTGFGIYTIIGSPQLPGKPYAERISASNTSPSLDELVARVEDHLRKNPDDARGWTIIAPSYMKLGRYADAAQALERVMKLKGPTADLMSGYGEALVMANQGIVDTQAKKVFQDALRRDPSKPTAQYYLGLAEVQAGDKEAAVKRWQNMLKSAPANANWRPQIEAQIRKAGGEVPKSSGVSAGESSAEGGAPDIDAMVSGLAARLEKNGKDLNGWLMLARAYVVLNKRDEAGKALDRAEIHFKTDSDAMKKIDAARKTYSLAGQKTSSGPQADTAKPPADTGAPDIGAMVSGLAARLKDDGNDLKGWIMLAQSYMVLKRKDDARKALESAETHFKDKAEAMSQIKAARKRFGL